MVRLHMECFLKHISTRTTWLSLFTTMQASSTFKRAFLHLMLKGLNEAHSKTSMSFLERKNAIKLSANSALAIARGRTAWSRALIADPTMRDRTKSASKKILRRSLRRTCKKNAGPSSAVVARRMMKKRTRLLKKLIPGGESLNSLSLLADNAVDYAIHLQAQVNIMQCIARALGASTAFKFHKCADGNYGLQESGSNNCGSKLN